MQQIYKFLIIGWILSFITVSISFASSTEFATLLNAVKTMKADFKQTIYDNRQKPVQTSLGQMAFSRPGKFRWQVKQPIPQLIIANGTKLWIYDEDLQQVVIRSLDKAVGETPALLLSHVSASIDNDFIVKESLNREDSLQWFELIPRHKDKMFEKIEMGFDKQQIREMKLQDQLGHVTRVQFVHATVNQNIATNTFEFKAPARVDIIDETHKK